MMPFRILSLDGGGVWAVIQVKALIKLYGGETSGHQVLQDFDLVAGTSGGSIVLGGLVENVTLNELMNYFAAEANRKAIFSPTKILIDQAITEVLHTGPKYSSAGKFAAFRQLMPKTGDIRLPAATAGIRREPDGKDVHLLITAFDYDRNCASFFRSALASGPDWGEGAPSNATLAEAIHASTNAPVVFFDEPASFANGRYWDGAITGCNNPVLAAVAEAIVLGNDPLQIAALSIGTSAEALIGPPGVNPGSSYYQARPQQGFLTDLQKLASSVTDEPPDIATFLAHVMTGGKRDLPAGVESRIVRMNPLRSPIVADDRTAGPPGEMSEAQFAHFLEVPMDVLDPDDFEYITTYADYWLDGLALNQPIRLRGDTLTSELGYSTFSAALDGWNAVKDR
jgi:uncharacterized protein